MKMKKIGKLVKERLWKKEIKEEKIENPVFEAAIEEILDRVYSKYGMASKRKEG